MFLHDVVCLWWLSPICPGAGSVDRTIPVKRSVWRTAQSAAVIVTRTCQHWRRQATTNNLYLETLFSSLSAVTTQAPLSVQQWGSIATLGMRILALDLSLWRRKTASPLVQCLIDHLSCFRKFRLDEIFNEIALTCCIHFKSFATCWTKRW